MRRLHFACSLILSAVALTAASSVLAQNEVKKDPKGIKGISPFWESVKVGDAAYVARDYDGAIAAYTQALASEPQNGLGHYRIGEAHLAKGDLRQAEEAWVAALRFAAGDPALRAKVLFVLADLRERQLAYPEAKDGWSNYEAHVKGQPAAAGYPETAPERQKRIDTWVDIKQQYAAVKERIVKRLAEVEEKQRKDAK